MRASNLLALPGLLLAVTAFAGAQGLPTPPPVVTEGADPHTTTVSPDPLLLRPGATCPPMAEESAGGAGCIVATEEPAGAAPAGEQAAPTGAGQAAPTGATGTPVSGTSPDAPSGLVLTPRPEVLNQEVPTTSEPPRSEHAAPSRPFHPEDTSAEIWASRCSSCHGRDGSGQQWVRKRRAFPDLREARWQDAITDEAMLGRIQRGVPNTPMRGFGEKMSDAQLHGLVRYVRALRRDEPTVQ